MTGKGYHPDWAKISKAVKLRDGNSCVLCQANGNLEVHHINEEPSDNNQTNLVTLCRPCHRAIHSEHGGYLLAKIGLYLSELLGHEVYYETSMMWPYGISGKDWENGKKVYKYTNRVPSWNALFLSRLERIERHLGRIADSLELISFLLSPTDQRKDK